MSEIKVQLEDGVARGRCGINHRGRALKKLDRDLAKKHSAARVNGAKWISPTQSMRQENGAAVKIEPVLPQTLAGLDVLRHSTAHLLAAAVLDLFRERAGNWAGAARGSSLRFFLRCDCTATFD